jgi:hypothetical protein
LNLELVCTDKTPARDALDVWPALPLVTRNRGNLEEEGLDNIIAALECSDRVRGIELGRAFSSYLEKLSAAMEVPFPELTDLDLETYREVVAPDSFLGGFTPRLRILRMSGISFPGLPRLLLSANHLITLSLDDIPHSVYISPEATFTTLSALASLNSLTLRFQPPLSPPDPATRRPHPPTRSVLPVLTYFYFKGGGEYLHDLVAHIDAPRLNQLYIIFFNQIVFDTPQLIQFISHAPRLKAPEKAHVAFGGHAATVKLSSLTSGDDILLVGISCRELDWQVSWLHYVLTSSLPPLSTLEDLYITEYPHWPAHSQVAIENSLWLELLHPFRTVKNLYLSKESASRIVPALEELVGSRASEVLPTLQNIKIWGPVQEGIWKFVSARRQVTGDSIVVSGWNRGQAPMFDD